MNGTKTSSFGVSARINHNSQDFYNSRLYKENGVKESHKETEDKSFPSKYLDKFICQSSEKMSQLPDNSLHLMVTSPPYNVGKDYDEDLSLEEYKQMLRNVFKETYRVLVSGGRAVINVANIGRKPYIPLHSHIIQIMEEIGFLMRGEIIWDKSSSAGTSTAWGSWQSASNPILRDVHEYILVFSKDKYSRNKEEKKNTITKEQFLENTKSLWNFSAVSAKKIGHPAPFPEELPKRIIQLYTFEGDIVLDPFMGSGTTAIAARKAKRYFVGYDTSKEYCQLARKRMKNETEQTRLT